MQLYKGKYFEVIFVDWCQEFIGQCIMSGNKENLSDMTSEEWTEFGKIEKELERVCKKLFNTTMFNFACLMNNAYRDNEKPHVHFQFIPRYRDKVYLFNKTYIDKHFGYNFWKWANSKFKRQKDIFTKEERIEIFNMMKEEFLIDNIEM